VRRGLTVPHIRVALVGCGRIARVHRTYLAELPTVQLVGVCDRDPAARDRFAAAANVPAFATPSELLAATHPEVVHVLTPPRSHAAVAIRALEAGANVLVEKPLAMCTAEADAVLAVARRTGRWVTVDHNRWFDPIVQEAARRVADGGIGRLRGVEVFQGAEIEGAGGDAAADWRLALPGGALHNLASHPLYLARRFAGELRERRLIVRAEDGVLEEVRLAALGEQAPALITLSLRTRPFMNWLRLLGEAATLELNLNNMTMVCRAPRSLPKLLGKVWPNLSEAWQLVAATARNAVEFAAGRQRFYPGIGGHLRTLYARLAAGEPPPVSAAEGRDVVVWYDEILAAAGVEVPRPVLEDA
jgi:predicted dehydrogenase